ncbi:MAG: methylated-DNA--[protein]-cysteine S-methyltransferase, partial [Leuconostoc gelidum]
RAVASAVGKNPLTIINACHRIVPKSGGIGQYRYGSEMKQKLRQLDQSMMVSKLAEKSDIITL